MHYKPPKQPRRPAHAIPASGTDGRQLAARLKQARKDKGLVQMELARKIGTTKSVISRMENHAGNLRLSTLRKLAAALGLRLEIKLA
jgi:HTH-type transcriptional regulator / antitoxin HipB